MLDETLHAITTLELSDLSNACAILKKVTEAKTTIPILTHVLFDGKGGLIATDLDIEFTYNLKHDSDYTPFTVNLNDLQKAMKGATKGGLVTFLSGDNIVTIVSDGMSSDCETHPCTNWPHMAKMKDGNTFQMSVAELHDALSFVASNMCKSEVRYYLNGAFFTQYNDKLTIVATDGNRAGKVETSADCSGDVVKERIGVIIPRKTVLAMIFAMSKTGSDGAITIETTFAKTKFSCGAWSVVTKNTDGTFPDWTRIQPSISEKTITLDRAVVLKAIARLNGVSEKPAIAIECGKNSSLYADEGKRKIAINPIDQGESFIVGINGAYLSDMFKSFDCDEIHISNTGSRDPIAVTNGGDRTKLGIIMPTRL